MRRRGAGFDRAREFLGARILGKRSAWRPRIHSQTAFCWHWTGNEFADLYDEGKPKRSARSSLQLKTLIYPEGWRAVQSWCREKTLQRRIDWFGWLRLKLPLSAWPTPLVIPILDSS